MSSDAFTDSYGAWRKSPFPQPPDDHDLDEVHKDLIYIDAMVADAAIAYADGRAPGGIPTQALHELDRILRLAGKTSPGLSEADLLRVAEYVTYARLLQQVLEALPPAH